MSARYAVYFAPDRYSPWWAFASHWLGRNEHDNTVLAQPALEGIGAAELFEITQEPRRYGFHATLRAPFRLAPGCDEEDLIARVSKIALSLQPLPLGPMRVTTLDNFVALVPERAPPNLEGLAASCVRELDALRAPMLEAERARRHPHTLDARGLELLDLHGYPHVMERFVFHMTLTGTVDQHTAQRVTQTLNPVIDRLNTASPLSLDRLCLFIESAPQAPFRRLLDLKLRAGSKP